jgi:hypothetical protein
MSKGLKRVAVGVVGITAAVIGVAIAGHVGTDSNGGLKPYGLAETLPGMVSTFGSNARVVKIIVGSSGVYYQVIGSDRQLHIRDYTIAQSEIDAGTYGYNRKTNNVVRAPTVAESRSAVVTLGQIDPNVVGGLYSKVGFPRQGSSATLTGRSWFLESGAQPEHRFLAAYDGNGVQRTQSAAPPDPNIAPAPTTPSTVASRSNTTTTYSFTTTITSGATKPGKLSRATQRLTTCITRAQGDVNKIVVCERKFVP